MDPFSIHVIAVIEAKILCFIANTKKNCARRRKKMLTSRTANHIELTKRKLKLIIFCRATTKYILNTIVCANVLSSF